MILFMHILFILGFSFYGYFLANYSWFQAFNFPQPHLVGTGIGFLLGLIGVSIDAYFKRYTVRNLLSILIGAAIGFFVHQYVMYLFSFLNLSEDIIQPLSVASALLFVYLGAVIIMRGADEYSLMIPFIKLDTKGAGEELILLDTSVIIDGRIADICETHFLSGKLILPRFVLKELQLIADSSDPLKRNRGRRGLDVLNRVKTNPNVQVKINEMDFPEFSTVDAKLVKMGQALNAKVFTNDFNLNKVAELQGVKVLNINELANALKPIVMPGELMEVKILKEGKEHDQGVAYLDDGTMVVVDNGRRRIGQTLHVSITSVLQTQAGRMIFAKLSDEAEQRPERSSGDRDRGGKDRFHRHGGEKRSGHNQPAGEGRQ